MNSLILPMAYRRYRHAVRRSSRAERTLPKMRNSDPLNAKPGEVATHRASKTLVSTNISSILLSSRNLSNSTV